MVVKKSRKQNTVNYTLKKGGRVVYRGITNDPVRRAHHHRANRKNLTSIARRGKVVRPPLVKREKMDKYIKNSIKRSTSEINKNLNSYFINELKLKPDQGMTLYKKSEKYIEMTLAKKNMVLSPKNKRKIILNLMKNMREI